MLYYQRLIVTTPYTSTTSLQCRRCGHLITLDNEHIGPISGRKIPLDVDTNEPHDCPARKTKPETKKYALQLFIAFDSAHGIVFV